MEVEDILPNKGSGLDIERSGDIRIAIICDAEVLLIDAPEA